MISARCRFAESTLSRRPPDGTLPAAPPIFYPSHQRSSLESAYPQTGRPHRGRPAHHVASAQVKTDGEWRGLGGAALSVSSGNTTSSALLVNLDMARATERDKITLGAAVNYAKNKSDGVSRTTANKWAATGQYDYN
jgi:uncharacterized protein DUF481